MKRKVSDDDGQDTKEAAKWKIEKSAIANSSVIILKSPDELTTATVYLFGATVTSWKVNDKEQLLLSNTAVLDGSKAIRGGIPVVFPQFAQPLATMPQHGFARTNQWETVSESLFVDSEKACLSLKLDANEKTRAVWPHEFKALYEIELSATSLTCSLQITNSGATDFQCMIIFICIYILCIIITKYIKLLTYMQINYCNYI